MARIEQMFIDRYRIMNKGLLDKGKTLVIVVDMVKGFCEAGAMADREILKIVPEITKLLKYYPHHLYFQDYHEQGSTELTVFPPHCLKDTQEAELLDIFKEDASASTIIQKNSTNGFLAPNFMTHAQDTASRFDNFVITGCCTDICVMQFALTWMTYLQQNNYLDKKVIVPLNAVDTYQIQGQHNAATFNRMAVHLMENAGIQILRKIS